jgi:DNA-binding response OmpR family regulator
MSSGKKILVVDDEPDVVKWLTVLFEHNDYQVNSAADGAEGYAKAEADPPDLITLDISMEGESGIKMYKKLLDNQSTATIPVIMLTGASAKLDGFLARMRSSKQPAAFMEKPVTDTELLAKVRELLG